VRVGEPVVGVGLSGDVIAVCGRLPTESAFRGGGFRTGGGGRMKGVGARKRSQRSNWIWMLLFSKAASALVLTTFRLFENLAQDLHLTPSQLLTRGRIDGEQQDKRMKIFTDNSGVNRAVYHSCSEKFIIFKLQR
jgi:hypothetical protein